MLYTPRIATHWTEKEAEMTYCSIKDEAVSLSEEEIAEKTRELMAEADKWSTKMIHDPAMQECRDRMYKRWVDEASEMAAIWANL